MEAAWLHRMRWRRRGAWLWPTFIAATVVDGVIGHALPPAGDTETVPAAVLAGLVLNLIAVVLLSRPLGALLRRLRPDLPVLVARNYAGTGAVLLVTAVVLCAGLSHRPTLIAQQRVFNDALARAEAFIGVHAPAEFRRNLMHMDTFTIEPGSIYRSCVTSPDGARTYCVIVKDHLPLARSVSFDGYEPNSVFAEGVG
jgi:hypothetical protein